MEFYKLSINSWQVVCFSFNCCEVEFLKGSWCLLQAGQVKRNVMKLTIAIATAQTHLNHTLTVEQKRNEIKKRLNELESEIENQQVRVFFVDESHLRWGDVLGYVWGKSAERISVPIVNAKRRQTYYGALDIKSKEVLVRPLAKGNSKCTIEFIKYLLSKSNGQRIVLIWDGASYHKSYELQDFLNEINQDFIEEPRA